MNKTLLSLLTLAIAAASPASLTFNLNQNPFKGTEGIDLEADAFGTVTSTGGTVLNSALIEGKASAYCQISSGLGSWIGKKDFSYTGLLFHVSYKNPIPGTTDGKLTMVSSNDGTKSENFTIVIAAVPEPASFLAFGVGGLVYLRRSSRRR